MIFTIESNPTTTQAPEEKTDAKPEEPVAEEQHEQVSVILPSGAEIAVEIVAQDAPAEADMDFGQSLPEHVADYPKRSE